MPSSGKPRQKSPRLKQILKKVRENSLMPNHSLITLAWTLYLRTFSQSLMQGRVKIRGIFLLFFLEGCRQQIFLLKFLTFARWTKSRVPKSFSFTGTCSKSAVGSKVRNLFLGSQKSKNASPDSNWDNTVLLHVDMKLLSYSLQKLYAWSM